MSKSTETNFRGFKHNYEVSTAKMAKELNADEDIDIRQWLDNHKEDMIDETQKTLKIAGYKELYPKQARDVVIFLSIKNHKTVFETDDALDELGLKTLLAKD